MNFVKEEEKMKRGTVKMMNVFSFGGSKNRFMSMKLLSSMIDVGLACAMLRVIATAKPDKLPLQVNGQCPLGMPSTNPPHLNPRQRILAYAVDPTH